MQLSHEFKTEDREYYRYAYSCLNCRRSDRGLELHHIKGRKKHQKYLSSIFNSFLICRDCHSKILHTKEEERNFVLITMKYLQREGYIPQKIDINYLEEYKLLDLIKEL